MKTTDKYFLSKAKSIKTKMRSETKKKFLKVIQLRLKGYSLDSIAKHLDLVKSRIFKLENVLLDTLNDTQLGEYRTIMHESKDKLKSIK